MNEAIRLVAILGFSLIAAAAQAHVSIASGPAYANTSQEIAFGVGHGCDNADTYSVRIEVPEAVASIRPMRSDFGHVSVEKNDNGKVTAITWQKPDTDALDSDYGYYKLIVRAKVPNAPFTQIYWLVHQTCRAGDGTLSTTEWTALPGASEGEPAVALTIVPARLSGWNKYTVPTDVTDLSVYFQDAQIVWLNNAAYSFNANTVEQIAASKVQALSELHANDVIWVRY